MKVIILSFMLVSAVLGEVVYNSASIAYDTKTAIYFDPRTNTPTPGVDVDISWFGDCSQATVVIGKAVPTFARAKQLVTPAMISCPPTVVWKRQLQLSFAPVVVMKQDIAVPCDTNGDAKVDVVDVQKVISVTLKGITDVSVLQTIINAVLTGGCGL